LLEACAGGKTMRIVSSSALAVALISTAAIAPAEAAPTPPTVQARFASVNEFSTSERNHASQAWVRAAKATYLARWFVHQIEAASSDQRVKLWNGTASFPGNTSWGVPRVWFGAYSSERLANVRDVLDTIWDKFDDSPWKMKRAGCDFASAHVIIVPQVRLCNGFFGVNTRIASSLLVHEMSHHVWIKSPLRQVVDRHVAPIPPCNGTCYGVGDAQMLAKDYPQHAVANPENYRFFADNYAANLGY
jgi:hypothetical protein